jgi:hypothetical protein
MNRELLIIAAWILSGTLLAQESPTTPIAQHLRIIQGPRIELSGENLTIIRWTTNNPGGSPALRSCALRYGSKSPDRDSQISSQVEPRSRFDGIPCAPR